MLSVIIPARNELFLNETIVDILKKAQGEIEIIPILDGYLPDMFIEDSRVKYVHFKERQGMRAGINAAVGIAKGDFLMKSDAHCMYEEGFDLKLAADCDDNWVAVPLRHRLDAEKWDLQPQPKWKHPFCYGYMDSPFRAERFMQNANWLEKDADPTLQEKLIDDNMIFQGSCWFCKKSHFERIGNFDVVNYWGWEQEPQELVCKTWLSGGRVIVNKKTWYAHLHKGPTYGRMYHMPKTEVDAGHRFSARYWLNNSWPGQIHKFEWLIDKFWPIPTWPKNWRDLRLEDYA